MKPQKLSETGVVPGIGCPAPDSSSSRAFSPSRSTFSTSRIETRKPASSTVQTPRLTGPSGLSVVARGKPTIANSGTGPTCGRRRYSASTR